MYVKGMYVCLRKHTYPQNYRYVCMSGFVVKKTQETRRKKRQAFSGRNRAEVLTAVRNEVSRSLPPSQLELREKPIAPLTPSSQCQAAKTHANEPASSP